MNTVPQFVVQGFDARLQQQMRPRLAPLHLLAFAKPFAHHLIHGRLHEPRGNRLAVAIPLAIVRDQVAVVPNIRAEFCHGFAQLLELRIRLFEVVDQGLDVLNFVQGFVEIAMPQRPFEPRDLLPHSSPNIRITVHQGN